MGEGQSKAYWQKDEDCQQCTACLSPFTVSLRRHHCRNCGLIFCRHCSSRACPLPMRGMSQPVRVCDACYQAVTGREVSIGRDSMRSGGSRQPSSIPPERVLSPPTAVPHAAASSSHIINNASTNNSAAATAVAQPVPAPSQQTGGQPPSPQQQHIDPSPSPAAAAASSVNNEAYHSAYNSSVPALAGGRDHADSNVTPDQVERQLLVQRWATVRQQTRFIDVLVQRGEKVEPDSVVEYSRETENITLQPELHDDVLRASLVPLPQPVDDSDRLLMDVVKPIIVGPIKDALDRLAVAVGQQVAPRVSTEAVHRPCPTQFSEC